MTMKKITRSDHRNSPRLKLTISSPFVPPGTDAARGLRRDSYRARDRVILIPMGGSGGPQKSPTRPDGVMSGSDGGGKLPAMASEPGVGYEGEKADEGSAEGAARPHRILVP